MSRNIFRGRSVAALFMALALIFLSDSIYANLTGTWINHTAASLYTANKESMVHRIIDGNRYVYFCVRGGNYNMNTPWMFASMRNTDLLQLFRYDKSKPWTADNIQPLGSMETVKDGLPDVMEYSPRLGVLAVVYDNNKIDLIHDDGRIIYSGAFVDITSAKAPSRPNSITFDPEKPTMYLAISSGYLEIDVNTGELLKGVKLDKKTAWAARMGDNMVVIAGSSVDRKSYSTTAYIFPASNPPYRLDGKEIKLDKAIPSIKSPGNLTLTDLQALMPLTDTTFAAIAPSTSDTNFYLIAVTLDNGVARGELLSAQDKFDNAATADLRHLFRTDGFWQEVKDGYIVSGQTDLYMIKKGVDLDYSSSTTLADFKSAALTATSKATLDASEKLAKSTSFDGKKVWFYPYDAVNTTSVVDRGFYYREMDENGGWGEKSALVVLNAPAATVVADIEWNPKYGMLFRGPGCTFSESPDGPDLFFSYKDGVWTNRAYYANYPSKAPLSQGMTYVVTDPLNPDLIWGQYVQAGLLRMDLGNYSNALMYGRSNHTSNKKIEGYFGVYPVCPWWTGICNFSQVSFDNAGNMWYVYRDMFGSDYDSEYYHMAYTRLNLLTPEDRLKMGTVTAETELVMPKEYIIKNTESYLHARVLALKAPGNDNLVVHSPQTYISSHRSCQIYDHKGTLDDTSDDEYIFVEDLRDEEGNDLPYGYEYSIYEDPLNGELWINTDRGPMIVNPREIFAGSKKFRRLKIEGGETGDDFLFDNVIVLQMAHDRLGRKWLATQCEGVFCLSPDTKKILAHFTTANSPLPSDFAVSVGCDRETGAVFIGTEKGMVEFHPEGTDMNIVPAGTHLSVWPASLTPDYNGYINISGAVTGAEYEVSDNEGNTVATLGIAETSRMQWNARGTDGSKVAPGRYNIHRKGVEETHTVIVVN